jgi:hemerythrin
LPAPVNQERYLRRTIEEEPRMKPEYASNRTPRSVTMAIRHARRSLCNRLERMAVLEDEALRREFAGVVAAVEAGFRHEDLVMEMLGYERLREHRAENAVILRALHRALPRVDGGDCALGRQLVNALREVLALHRLNTDLALAVALPVPARMGTRARGRAARTTLHVANARRPAR